MCLRALPLGCLSLSKKDGAQAGRVGDYRENLGRSWPLSAGGDTSVAWGRGWKAEQASRDTRVAGVEGGEAGQAWPGRTGSLATVQSQGLSGSMAPASVAGLFALHVHHPPGSELTQLPHQVGTSPFLPDQPTARSCLVTGP